MNDGVTTAGFQGEPGAFSDEAARALLGEQIQTRGYRTFDDLLDAAGAGEVQYALLPCENSISGSIARAYDLLFQHAELAIVDETTHRVEQCLAVLPGAAFDDLRSVASHPVALEQCRRFLSQHPDLSVEPVDDTAGAVRQIVERGDTRCAAIGPAFAAPRYGAIVLQRAVQDDPDNQTRFFLLARGGTARRALGRACLAVTLPHRTGSLSGALATIASGGLNLRSLVARPNRKHPFEYVFYLEIDVPERFDLAGLAAKLDGETRVLGIY